MEKLTMMVEKLTMTMVVVEKMMVHIRVARAPFVFETTSALLTLNALAPRSAGAGIAGFERRRDQLV